MGKRTYQQKTMELLEHQAVNFPNIVYGSPVAVAGAHEIEVFISHAIVQTGSNSTGQVIALQGTYEDTANLWFDLDSVTANAASPNTEATLGLSPAGSTVIAVADDTGFAARRSVYLKHPTDVKQGEWATVLNTVPITSIVLTEGLLFDKPAGSIFYDLAEKFFLRVLLKGVRRVRIKYDNLGFSDSNTEVKVDGILVPSLMG